MPGNGHVRFGRRPRETHQQKRRKGAPGRSHLANQKLDEVRRRVQNETMGHRGRKDDPLYRCRRLLTKADERLDTPGRTKLLGLLDAGDPHNEVRDAWHAKELVRQLYAHTDHATAAKWVTSLDFLGAEPPNFVSRVLAVVTSFRETGIGP